MKIFDLIKIKLDELPNLDCINLGEETNLSGEKVIFYSLLLDEKEMGLFDTLKISVLPNNERTYTFSTLDKVSSVINRIKMLVNDLYSIYGEDGCNNGKFTRDDEEDLLNEEQGFWIGRDYIIDYYPGVMLGISDQIGLYLQISTWRY
jgi:hypothetical protein